ncbi:hypothetical protein GQ42DRAFT_178278 [Ramicandelaber brevisporus]|nr:hypothetical protein GQ42DRAFT_178278 [Ramicandelaber brevisporus]
MTTEPCLRCNEAVSSEPGDDSFLSCQICTRPLHLRCVRHADYTPMVTGDVFWEMTCANCANHRLPTATDDPSLDDVLSERRLAWTTAVHIIMYGLHKKNPDTPFLSLKEQLIPEVGKRWEYLFGHKAKTATWNATISGTLSTHREMFISGTDELGMMGYWRLIRLEPPLSVPLHSAKAGRGAVATPRAPREPREPREPKVKASKDEPSASTPDSSAAGPGAISATPVASARSRTQPRVQRTQSTRIQQQQIQQQQLQHAFITLEEEPMSDSDSEMDITERLQERFPSFFKEISAEDARYARLKHRADIIERQKARGTKPFDLEEHLKELRLPLAFSF